MKLKRIVVGIYTDPDFFPPTINAILNFAEKSEEVIVISRNNTLEDYPYPDNVHLKKVGQFCTVRDMENQSFTTKVFSFLKFLFTLFKYSYKSNFILLYDHFALFAFYLLKTTLGRKKIWYHNHDMPIKELINRFSLGMLAAKYEKKAMKYIDFFSLPSKERLQFYANIDSRIPVFIIPNYPSLKVYHNFSQDQKVNNCLRIIYQGFIGPGHSFEEVLECLAERKDDNFQYILKGSVTNEYQNQLNQLAGGFGVIDKIVWLPLGPYKNLPPLTKSANIGIGINWNTDIVSENQGTASNKIYEYAACGLPVILADKPQFRKYLDKFSWTFFTDGSVASLQKIISNISTKKIELATDARRSFEEELNFEKVFAPVLEKVMGSVEEYKMRGKE